MKSQTLDLRRHLQISYQTQESYTEYIKSSLSSTVRNQTTQLENKHKISIDISPKNRCGWQTNKEKDIQ